MSRPDPKGYDLSDAEKRDLVSLIQAGKPLPEKYRFVLFKDKHEVELVWNGADKGATDAKVVNLPARRDP